MQLFFNKKHKVEKTAGLFHNADFLNGKMGECDLENGGFLK